MTYYESYKALKTEKMIKDKAISDTKVALFLGGNPDRIKAIEDAMNKAISEMEEDKNETD